MPVFVWAILSYLDALPGLVLSFTVWDVIGTASYTLAFALLESLILLVLLVLLAFILPGRLLRNHFEAVGSMLVLITAVWVMVTNWLRLNPAHWMNAGHLPLWVLYLLSIVVPGLLTARSNRLERAVQAVIRRSAVLAYVYVALGCLGMAVVLLRNLG